MLEQELRQGSMNGGHVILSLDPGVIVDTASASLWSHGVRHLGNSEVDL